MQARGLSPRTIQYARSVLRRALGQAVRWHLLERNVGSATDTPRLVRRDSLAFGIAGVAAFKRAAKKDNLAAMWLLALDSGMRPEEYFALTWSNVDLDAGVVRVQRVLSRRKKSKEGDPVLDTWYFTEPKTRGSVRSIHLAAQTVAALRKHKVAQARQRLALGAKWKDTDLVSTDSLGGPLHSSNLHKRHFKDLVTAAKLPKGFRPYDLRHSCATILLEKGIRPKIVQERLGHASSNMTLDVYSHVTPTMQTAASDALEEVFGGQSSKSKKPRKKRVSKRGGQSVGKSKKPRNARAA
jgi:integrase